ncbi:biopolymer transporter ExbD [Lysobacter sp. BMK333-48F3]|uniref:ExbD/TolR family protein n=1 Tax=Lysobacter sp. BMK333-48F3 TaxID=2867962 RepID=UPI001C8B2D74|nr:biopolymer transporter ExbD [Lysobacter sp. BMK333-48F3]MBX9401026.1 biopolymer transporter ExbD [Lysobacter sp. BMK333-48F3]
MAGSRFSAPAYAGNAPVAEINVTPLVDVMLVLLIIFMVTAPALTGKIDLGLPVPGKTAAEPPPKASLMVRQDGGFELDGRSLAAGELPAALKALARSAPNTVLEIGANADADYQGFAHALSAAQDSGIENISTSTR